MAHDVPIDFHKIHTDKGVPEKHTSVLKGQRRRTSDSARAYDQLSPPLAVSSGVR